MLYLAKALLFLALICVFSFPSIHAVEQYKPCVPVPANHNYHLDEGVKLKPSFPWAAVRQEDPKTGQVLSGFIHLWKHSYSIYAEMELSANLFHDVKPSSSKFGIYSLTLQNRFIRQGHYVNLPEIKGYYLIYQVLYKSGKLDSFYLTDEDICNIKIGNIPDPDIDPVVDISVHRWM